MSFVRAAVPADLAAIAAIYRPEVLGGTATYEIDPPDEAEFARRREAVLAAGLPWLVAEIDGRVAGYAYAGPFRPRAAYRWTVENSIYVAAAAKGRGVGSLLLEHLVADVAARGFRQMIAVIGDSRNLTSVRLHERAGFTLAGTYRAIAFKHGRWLDSMHMQRTLGDGGTSPPDGAPEANPAAR